MSGSSVQRSFSIGLFLSALLAAPAWAQCPASFYGSGSSTTFYTKGARGGAGTAGGPASPSPAGPSAPSPAGPSTPATPGAVPTPAGGVIPGAPTPLTPRSGPRRGMPLVFTHGATSKRLLEIDWEYPVYAPAEAPTEGLTAARPARRALSFDEAMSEITGEDTRPVLVLRECLSCRGTDLALLSREFANERTMLLTDWFHCVKLPATVSAKDHPFHALFPDHSHLFLAQADGKEMLRFDGRQSQRSLWKAMNKVLKANYKSSPERNVKALLKLLTQFDVVDAKQERLLRELDKELETKGPRTARFRKLKRELDALTEDRKELLAQERQRRKLAK
ncbi:MAG: hypothetical protein VYE77_03715 [Planctomycetota bacterium]|nr:hypothetical protein [Planctomycetota bacterium]